MQSIARARRILIRLSVAFGLVVLAWDAPRGFGDDWPQFRGRNALGIADGQDLPDTWNVETGENIRWKTHIPGLGHACPIVSRGRVFIVTADSGEVDPELRLGLYGDFESVAEKKPHAWRVYCLSQATGRVLWSRTLHQGVPAIKRHAKASYANATPVTDGERLVVSLGSEGLYCLDFCGRLLWRKDLGVLDAGYFAVPDAQWGFGSSPIIHHGMVILQCDVQKNSFLAAFDIRNGNERWRTAREDVPTWSTPTIVRSASRTELVVNGYKHAGGYDPSNGEPLWKLGGGGDIPVPTPIFAHDLIFLSSAHGKDRPLCAVRPGASGDITPESDGALGESLAWYKRRDGIYMQTPIVYGDYLYACRDNGVMSCYDAQAGERLYQERLGSGTGGFTASPVAADGKLYFTSEEGAIYIVAAGPEFNRLASNEMGAACMATPAIADGLLIVRTTNHVIAIGYPSRQNRRTSSVLQRLRSWRFRLAP